MNWKLTRPKNLQEFIGKKELKNNLKTYLKAAKINNRPLDHCLFYGVSGTGKTSLAYIIANELKAQIKIVQGGNIQKAIDIYNIALNIKKNTIIFIDEIHNVAPYCLELLYSLMEDFVIDLVIGKDYNSKITRVPVEPFTLIGATTILSKIPQPLEDRFGIIFNFLNYNSEEIFQILKIHVKKLKLEISDDDLNIISSNSKGIPRNAIRLLYRVSDYLITNDHSSIKNILSKIGIIEDGLDNEDLYFLKLLNSFNKPVGIKTLMQTTNWDISHIETKIEPYLISNNYLIKTNTGRLITQKGKKLAEKY